MIGPYPLNSIITGDARNLVRALPDNSIHCIVTSPPYFGLRDYGVSGQIGLEQTPGEYVAELVSLFRELRRAPRDDGTLFLNLGDSYASQGGPEPAQTKWQVDGASKTQNGGRGRTPGNLKPKDLMMIPARVALALQDDGWWLRSDIIWSKPNPMPESVTDRPTTSHEHIFLLTKSERYFYDAEAIKEPIRSGPSDTKKMIEGKDRIDGRYKSAVDPLFAASSLTKVGRKRAVGDPSGRNRRTVWEVATQPYSEAHFATFPPKLIEPCILAGCPLGGVVLDPFMGAGTTGVVARQFGRNWLGFELNPAYVELARKRIDETQPALPMVAPVVVVQPDQPALFAA